MRRVLDVYQYVAPAILTPLGYLLWLTHYGGDHRLALFALGIPIAFAYVVPAVGTNILGVWEFDTRLKLGRFRPQHGFVFGSATSLLVLPVFARSGAATSIGDALAAGFLTASVLGFWNWIYDIGALRAGVLKVYNQPWADGAGAAAIATDYAPLFFGGFGFVHGAGLVAAEGLARGGGGDAVMLLLATLVLILTIACTVLPYMAWSRWWHGHNGCRPVAPRVTNVPRS